MGGTLSFLFYKELLLSWVIDRLFDAREDQSSLDVPSLITPLRFFSLVGSANVRATWNRIDFIRNEFPEDLHSLCIFNASSELSNPFWGSSGGGGGSSRGHARGSRRNVFGSIFCHCSGLRMLFDPFIRRLNFSRPKLTKREHRNNA